ncbi:murein biosynthesis integral membrane protein MurJ [Geothrix campi]|jgi:putative peptidoglycan lipid II flippase|uniref:murein biosynthesis integral membrane protein MurJ n=1 Tax=Geothrix campi TaxID=2966450 RepID=UPI002147F2E5|nr:lipid II flippase MurJ [Geothrix sp. SG10]
MVVVALRRVWSRLPLAVANRGVVRAVLTVGFFAVGVKVVSVVKESMVAATFGTSNAFDAFVIATLAPTVVVSLISNSLNAALIPTYIGVRKKEGQDSAGRLYATVLLLNLMLLAVLSLVIALTTPRWLPLIASGFSAEKLALAQRLVYWSMPLVVATGLSTTWGAILNAQERFGVVALAPALQPLSILLVLLVAFRLWGIGALVAGTLLGAVLEAGLIGYSLFRQGHSLLPHWHGLTEPVRRVLAQYGATISGAFLITSMSLVDQGMASMLGPGSNSALSYGMKIPSAFAGLGMAALGTAVLPRFSQLVSDENWLEFRRTLWKYLLIVGALSILLACGLAVGSKLITTLLYERGRFQARDTELVSWIQMFYLLRLPIPITATLLVRALNAMRANHILAAIAVLQAVLNAVLDWVFMQRMGAPGIAAASLGVSMVAFTCVSLSVWWLLDKHCRGAAVHE